MAERWKCLACGSVFYEPDVYETNEDMNGEGAWYTWCYVCCPCCGSEEISENKGEDEDDA